MKIDIRKIHLAFALAFLISFVNKSAAQPLDDSDGIHQNEFESITWKRVVDQQGSSLNIPISVVIEKKDKSRIIYHSKDGKLSIYFSTTTELRSGFPGHDPKGDMNLKRSDCNSWPPEYMVVKQNVAAYSCIKNNNVNYYISKYNKSGSVTLYVEYPAKNRFLWDKIVSKMAASVREVKRMPD